MTGPTLPILHPDGSVTYREPDREPDGRTWRTVDPSPAWLATLNEHERARVLRHCRPDAGRRTEHV